MTPPNILNQAPSGVVQNNKAMIFFGGLLVAGLFIFLMYRFQMSQKAPTAPINEPKTNVDMSLSKSTVPDWMIKYQDEKTQIIGAFVKPKTSQEVEKESIENKKLAIKKEITEDQEAAALEIQQIEDKNKVDQKKLEFAAQEAPMTIVVPPPPSAPAADKSSLTNSLSNEIDALKSAGDAVKNKSSIQDKISDLNNQDEKISFLKTVPDDSEYLKKGIEAPKSPFEVKAGTYIPAALIGGINSDMPGSVVGQVRENVYDTVTGNIILIPQGTKIVGSYDSKVTFGQSGVLVVWSRLIFPDGSSIDLENMQGMDINGLAGFRDKLNNHYLKIYGNALLLSLVGAGYNLLTNNPSTSGQLNASQAVAANVGQQLSDVASKSLQRNMDVQPTITIRPGFKFNIFVMKDMILKEIKDTDGTLDIQ